MERNYIKEKKAAVKEFDDKKVELKENLIAELEEKKKMIENEKLTMELTGGPRKQRSSVKALRSFAWERGVLASASDRTIKRHSVTRLRASTLCCAVTGK